MMTPEIIITMGLCPCFSITLEIILTITIELKKEVEDEEEENIYTINQGKNMY